MSLGAWVLAVVAAGSLGAERVPFETSEDGLVRVETAGARGTGASSAGTGEVPYPLVPDWMNDLRRQVGGLQVADVNGDGKMDLVVGVYNAPAFPEYEDWENLIYLNTGSELEASPSWVSTDEVSTGDVQVGDVDGDTFPDVFAANGGFPMDPSVVYFGSASGPSTTPGWTAADVSWTNHARLFDLDHDDDLDVVTANQGNDPNDPFRPMRLFPNDAGVLSTTPTWESAESSIQNFLDFGDLDGDGWEDLAVSKWVNFESGVYANDEGDLSLVPVWTTGDTDSDKGIAWADVDGDRDLDLALGHDPTLLYHNVEGTPTPVWSSTAPFFGQQDLRWADVDLDGDPDLAEVHFSNGHVSVYLNRDGTLDAAPTWTFDSPAVGTAVAFGDIDGDGAPDMVVGNAGKPSLYVFYNLSVLFGDGFESGDTSAWPAVVE